MGSKNQIQMRKYAVTIMNHGKKTSETSVRNFILRGVNWEGTNRLPTSLCHNLGAANKAKCKSSSQSSASTNAKLLIYCI